jgi:hypothetical protein
VEVGLLEDDVDNIELVATAEDEAFIDDEGGRVVVVVGAATGGDQEGHSPAGWLQSRLICSSTCRHVVCTHTYCLDTHHNCGGHHC